MSNPGIPIPPNLSYGWRANRRQLHQRSRLPPSPPPRNPEESWPLIASIEQQTQQNISIATSFTPEIEAQCNPQAESPLFRVLPPELRSEIFAWATLPHLNPEHKDDPDRTYRETDFYYRADHKGKPSTSTSLLLTCRRVFLEANHLPLQQYEPVFFFNDVERCAPWARAPRRVKRLKDLCMTFTPNNRRNFKRIRIFAQMYWLEQSFLYSAGFFLGHRGIAPEIFTITVRFSDWWYWEQDAALRVDDDWVHGLLDTHAAERVKEIRLELEVLDSKIGQLRPIIERLKAIRPRVRKALDHDGGKRWRWVPQEYEPESTWSGPTNPGGGETHAPYQKLKTLDYRMVTIVWRAIEVGAEEPHVPDVGGGRTWHLASDYDWSSDDEVDKPHLGRTLKSLDSKEAEENEMSPAKVCEDRWKTNGSLLDFVKAGRIRRPKE